MAGYPGNNPTMQERSNIIHNALVGALPSFGRAKESKLQHLMQRNMQPNVQNYDEFDTSLSVKAKAFQPNQGNPVAGQHSPMVDTVGAFNNLDLGSNGDMGMNRMNVPGNQPAPLANEFVPRNMSAPVLNPNQQNGSFNFSEFLPSGSMNRSNVAQQQQASMMSSMPQSNLLLQQNANTGPYTDVVPSSIPQHLADTSRSSMPNYMPGNQMAPSSGGPLRDSHFSGSSIFPTKHSKPPPQNNSANFFTSDSNAPFTPGHGYPTPGPSVPFSQQPMDSLMTTSAVQGRTSPLLARRMTGQHRSSPLNQGPSGVDMSLNSSQSESSLSQQPMTQENGGTTYFFTQEHSQQPISAVMMPSFHAFPGPSASIEYMAMKANAPSFFMSNEARQAILQKHTLRMLTVDTEQDPTVPSEVDSFHSLFPLDPEHGCTLQKSSTFRYVTSCYKATKYKDGLSYCLRRIHGFRQVNEKCMTLVEMWKKLQHANIVQLREVFTSKAFGEHSLIFAHDYYPGAETMMARHFQNPNNNFASKTKWNGGTARRTAGLLPESLIWTYVVQLTSALRCIHAAGLACRVMDPTKILITDKSRIRINAVGVFDVLGYDSSNANPCAHMQQYQQDDMVAFGKVVLALACNSVTSFQQENMQKSIDLVVMNYSVDLKNLIMYLMTPQQRPHSVNDVMPMIGARFYTQLDAAMMRGDVIENELAKEVDNGRLIRMLCKLGVVNERPEFGIEAGWSETGDRYLLKLFRDHLFHQVTDTGAPWVDLPHIVQCLNKLDAGVPEKLCLMSRDEQNVLVVSYAELKKAFTKCYDELVATTSGL